MPDPAGGTINRNADGSPSGLLDEGAMMSIIWLHQAVSASKEDRTQAIRAAIQEYKR